MQNITQPYIQHRGRSVQKFVFAVCYPKKNTAYVRLLCATSTVTNLTYIPVYRSATHFIQIIECLLNGQSSRTTIPSEKKFLGRKTLQHVVTEYLSKVPANSGSGAMICNGHQFVQCVCASLTQYKALMSVSKVLLHSNGFVVIHRERMENFYMLSDKDSLK